MEDASTIILSLDEGKEDSNTFFAVYDGHGGEFYGRLWVSIIWRSLPNRGSTVAKYAGQNVHKRLISEESYLEKQYETALKKAFLGTDEDILAS
jgi:protein phosphatase PTC2/3